LFSLLAIVALTSPSAWPSRVLALPIFVYLGKISYALYLIQMAPLRLQALFGLPTAAPWIQVAALYAGMNVVSALLYELVEKPARKLILSIGVEPRTAGVGQA
jgi:peptidoglycan/LPS O-acetylase OafA/YrhL